MNLKHATKNGKELVLFIILGVTITLAYGVYLIHLWAKQNWSTFININEFILFVGITCFIFHLHVVKKNTQPINWKLLITVLSISVIPAYFVIIEFINWVNGNWNTFLTICFLSAIILIFTLRFYFKIIKDYQNKQFNRLLKEIHDFRPAKEFHNEYNYQLNLHGWLQRTFPSISFERQKGSSRPDLALGNIAIEIKGPTRHAELKTIADKCMRYNAHFSGGLVAVLFEVDVPTRLYSEWHEGLKRNFPFAHVVKKTHIESMQ